MNLEERLKALITWGKAIGALTDELESDGASESPAARMLIQAKTRNPWFTRENILEALKAIVFQLQEQHLRKWVAAYNFTETSPRTVGVVMAGNIPAVGFQDALCVLVSGNTLMMKCAADDNVILPFLTDILVAVEPRFRERILMVERLQNIDAVIATGSNNSARYFDYYFSKYPHIIRRNRNSVAMISGNETEAELLELGNAIFRYFGMGCRSVSHLLVPAGYDFGKLFAVLQQFGEVMNHSRYMNNYDYHNALYLLNSEKFLTNNFLILRESPILTTPVSVLHYSYYQSPEKAEQFLAEHKDEIQCRVGVGGIPFSEAQCPAPWDYADNVDVLQFLLGLQ